jgi:CHAT domain-containing protein
LAEPSLSELEDRFLSSDSILDLREIELLRELCISLAERRDYAKLDRCVKTGYRSLAKTDEIKPRLMTSIFNKDFYQASVFQYSLESQFMLLEAEQKLDYGQFDEALLLATKANALHDNKWKDVVPTGPFEHVEATRWSSLRWEKYWIPGKIRVQHTGASYVFLASSLPTRTLLHFKMRVATVGAIAAHQIRTKAASADKESGKFQAMIDNWLKIFDHELQRFDSSDHQFKSYKLSCYARIFLGIDRAADAVALLKEDHYAGEQVEATIRGLVTGVVAVAISGIPLVGHTLSDGPFRLAGQQLNVALGSAYTLTSKFQMAHLRVEAGDVVAAKPLLDDVLGDEIAASLGGIYWSVLYDRGRVAEREMQMEEAIKYYRQSIDEIEKIRSTINTEGSRMGFFGDKQDVYRRLTNILFQFGRYEEAFATSEQSKSRSLVDMLANKNDFRVASDTTEKIRVLLATKQEHDLALLSDGYSPGLLKGIDVPTDVQEANKVEVVRGIAGQIRSQTDSLNRSIAGLDASLASLVSVVKVAPKDIQKRLQPDQTILSYYYDKQSLLAFVIDSNRIVGIPLKREGLEDDVQRFRTLLADPESNYGEDAKQLFDRLISPTLIAVKTRNLTIAGHGVLHYLPFAALNDGKNFLAERFSLSFLPSASTIQFIGKDSTAAITGNILAFGNPNLGNSKYDLPGAEKEARIVARTLPHSMVFLRKDANKTNLKENAAGFRYLHFATHGVFEKKKPLDSALLLSPEGDGDIQSGKLTIGDLYTMHLDADLVTLSACESGLGEIGNGDDLVGLSRGFLYAGARNIVSSLWQVGDEATALLMETFYKNLREGQERAKALLNAQREVRHRGFDHPYYWAAFQLTGVAATTQPDRTPSGLR